MGEDMGFGESNGDSPGEAAVLAGDHCFFSFFGTTSYGIPMYRVAK
jgi:hypothetical protein